MSKLGLISLINQYGRSPVETEEAYFNLCLVLTLPILLNVLMWVVHATLVADDNSSKDFVERAVSTFFEVLGRCLLIFQVGYYVDGVTVLILTHSEFRLFLLLFVVLLFVIR